MKDKEIDGSLKSFIYSFIYLLTFIFIFVFGPLAEYGYILLIGVSIMTIFLNIALKIREDKRYNKIINEKLDYDYWREVKFRNITPVEAGNLLGVEKIGINTFAVILFELEKKDILNIEYVEKEFVVSLKSTNLDVINSLPYYERDIVKLLFSGTDDKSKLSSKQIVEMIKKDSTVKVYLDNIYEFIEKDIDIKYYESYMNHMVDNSSKYIFELVSFSNLIMNIFISIIYIISLIAAWNILVVPVVITGILQLIMTKYILYSRYIKEEYIEEVKKLKGLYNYIKDFSSIEEKEIKYYELYEDYFLYAVSMGVADKFEEELEYDKLANDIKTNIKFLFEYKEV